MSKTGSATQESDDLDLGLGLAATVVFIAAVLGWAILVGSFLFKVWNERQMTHAYDRQAVALERIADAVERLPLCWQQGHGTWMCKTRDGGAMAMPIMMMESKR